MGGCEVDVYMFGIVNFEDVIRIECNLCVVEELVGWFG